MAVQIFPPLRLSELVVLLRVIAHELQDLQLDGIPTLPFREREEIRRGGDRCATDGDAATNDRGRGRRAAPGDQAGNGNAVAERFGGMRGCVARIVRLVAMVFLDRRSAGVCHFHHDVTSPILGIRAVEHNAIGRG